LSIALLAFVLTAPAAHAQTGPDAAAAKAPKAEEPKDPLGRETPRGTVLGFLNAARKGENDLAARFLNTSLRGQDAATLANQLFVVLDARLPARLTQLSDAPEDGRGNPLLPDQDVVGAIESDTGNVDVVLTRVRQRDGAAIWLFSGETLAAVPNIYEEVTSNRWLRRCRSTWRCPRTSSPVMQTTFSRFRKGFCSA
jgi:MscS family membrane protein